MKFHVTNIEWDTDEDEINPDLPFETEVEADSEDEIADILSDTYDFCVISFDYVIG